MVGIIRRRPPPEPHFVTSATTPALENSTRNPANPKNRTEVSARKRKREKEKKKKEKKNHRTTEQLELRFLRLPQEEVLIMMKGKPPRNTP